MALLLGSAASITCPAALAEEIFDNLVIPEGDIEVAPPKLLTVSQAGSSDEPDYLVVPMASVEKVSAPAPAPASTSIQVAAPKQVYYLLNAEAPAPAMKKDDGPSQIDQFNERLSKVVVIELTATLNGKALGAVAVETTLSQVKAVDAVQLQEILGPELDDSTQLLLSQFRSGYVSVERLAAVGVNVRLDPATLTLVIDAPTKPQDPLELSISGPPAPEGTETASPANVAAGLTSTFLMSDNLDRDANPVLSTALSGFVNIGGPRGLNFDYGGIFTFDDGTGESRFDADRTILFMDRPEHALRFEAGTLYTPLADIAGEGDFLGVGITKSYRQLQPTRVLRPLGQRSFQLNRPSEVTVLVDGQPVSRFDAPAGEVNLRDIPLANVSNRVSIVVEDEFGRQETENFSITSDALLLDKGLSEYSFGVGQARDRAQSGYAYTDDIIAAGNYQYGVAPNLTMGAFGYYSEQLSIFGAESVFGLLDGIAQIQLGVSDSQTVGTGMAASANYRWNSAPTVRRAQSFAITADYRDEAYSTAGSQFGTSVKYDASAVYERQITDRLRVNVAGSYSEDYFSDTASTSFAVASSYQFGQLYFGAGVRVGSSPGRDDEVGGFLTLTRRIGQRSTVNARYDTQNDRASIRYRRPSRNEVGSFGFQSDLSSRDSDLTLRGAVDYTGNRYRSRVALGRGSNTGQLDGDTTLTTRFQTGIAFADGKFGIGRDPGRGFVMADRHKSLSDARVEIRSRGREGIRAQSGALGPAISRISSPFVPMTTRVDVANAPIGYNLGEGSYYSIPGARSGIRITVGTDAYRSVVATFIADGKPLGLSAARLSNLKTGESQVTFTNSAGRALLSNLVPGQYQLVFAGTDYKFNFEIEDSSEAFSNLGSIDLTTGETQ